MKIGYLIEVDNLKEELNKKTLSSLSGDYKVFTKDNLFDVVKTLEWDNAVIIPNNSELNENFEEIISVYVKEDSIMLPLTVLKLDNTSGVLNTCVWNSSLTGKIGNLDHELSLKQIDLTLYGALIPLKYLVEENFNKEVKYYGHFYFFNKVTKQEVPVIGVPKTLLTIEKDLFYTSITTDEKMKYFNMAKEI